MRLHIISLLLFLLPMAAAAQDGYKVNAAGQIVVQTTVENLPLTKGDIYNAALRYMGDAYDPTRFNVSVADAEHGTVVGDGTLVSFYDCQLGFNQYYLDMDFKLRVDAKDNRARISVIADKYSGKCIDGNKTLDVADKISEFQPVSKTNDDKRRMYTKAFPVMLGTFSKVIAGLAAKLKAEQGASVGSEDW